MFTNYYSQKGETEHLKKKLVVGQSGKILRSAYRHLKLGKSVQ